MHVSFPSAVVKQSSGVRDPERVIIHPQNTDPQLQLLSNDSSNDCNVHSPRFSLALRFETINPLTDHQLIMRTEDYAYLTYL